MSKPSYHVLELTDEQAKVLQQLVDGEPTNDQAGFLEGVEIYLDSTDGNMKFEIVFTDQAKLTLFDKQGENVAEVSSHILKQPTKHEKAFVNLVEKTNRFSNNMQKQYAYESVTNKQKKCVSTMEK
ncbi:Hypothetical_protein [Hexamita inflata]|uniref:Hypothetical_protein n=1 Tax=Hexamita inflata TaxID=28002 RepID=A0AA86PIA0_9EUKA|nr:Hypothetical protein HINF_LOCUS11265 [Hexamita inflata]CAI9938931.1 Hypothetical protein HINF_LOCUS26576 [Hexamita inflata]